MTPVGQVYRPSGPINFRSTLSTLILGIFTACLAALAIWAWENSIVPTLVILTPVLQGLLIGLVLAFVIGRLRLRNVKLLAVMGLLCGLTSVALVHVGHHMRVVHELAEQYKTQVKADQAMPAEQKSQLIEVIDKDPYKVADALLQNHTGYPGVVGSLLLRSETGVRLKNTELTGWGMWILWGLEAFLVALVATKMAHARASEPYCEDCQDWCEKSTGPLVLPGSAATTLVDAIQTDDIGGYTKLRDNPPEPDNTTYCGTTLHTCRTCEESFADVWLRTDKIKGKETQSTTQDLLRLVRVSPGMLDLIQNSPTAPAEELVESGPEELTAE